MTVEREKEMMANTSDSKTASSKKQEKKERNLQNFNVLRYLVLGTIHTFGTLVVALVMAVSTVSVGGVGAIVHWQINGGQIPWMELSIHLLLSAALWLLVVAVVQMIRGRKQPKRVYMMGSVITESLIVMPAFFLLFTVMVQICLFNVMGLLASAAAHQAARTVWLWLPEVEANGPKRVSGDVASEQDVEKLARVQAAYVMLPVGQSGFQVSQGKSDPMLKRALEVVVAPHLTLGRVLTGPSGAATQSLAITDASASAESSFYRAFDDFSFMTRAPAKFLQAYAALKQSKIIQKGSGANAEVGFEVQFEYISVFPFWGLFSSYGDDINGNILIKRSFTLPKQTPPNGNVPK